MKKIETIILDILFEQETALPCSRVAVKNHYTGKLEIVRLDCADTKPFYNSIKGDKVIAVYDGKKLVGIKPIKKK